MSKLCKNMYTAINIIYGVLFLAIVSICLLGNKIEYTHKKTFLLENWQYAIVGVVLLVIFAKLIDVVGKYLNNCRYIDKIMQVVSVLLGIGLIWITFHYYFKVGWDAGSIIESAKRVALGDIGEAQEKYFSYYPNNLFLTFIFSVLIRIGSFFGITNYYFVIVFFQCILFAIAGYLLYACVGKILDKAYAVLAWVCYVALIGLSPWVVIPYSDASGLIFPIVEIYLYLRVKRRENPKVCGLLLGILSYVGYSIKPQNVIVVIALLIVEVISIFEEKNWNIKSYAKKVFVIIGGFLLGVSIVSLCAKATQIEYDKEMRMGLPHYIMMGLNIESCGVISVEDQNFSFGIETIEERDKANLEVAGERLEELGVSGLLKLLRKKILVNFADGTFAWWEEGEFCVQTMYQGNQSLRKVLADIYYKDGKYFEYFKSFMQTQWMGILVLAGLACLRGKRNHELLVVRLSVIGIVLFELIFEARARYIFIYAPLFLILAMIVLHDMMQLMNKMRTSRK